jgi:hypothetical protein
MNAEAFERAVADAARRQSDRLRAMGFAAAAAELDALMPDDAPCASPGPEPTAHPAEAAAEAAADPAAAIAC